MKILFILPSKSRCGPSNVIFNIIKYLKSKDVNILLAFFWDGDKPLNDFVSSYVDKEINLNGFGLRSIIKLYSFIKKEQPDVIHSSCLLPDLYLFLLSVFIGDISKVSTLHCNIDQDYDTTYARSKIKKTIFKMIHKVALRKMDKVIAVSENAKDSLLSNNVKIIYNGTNKNKNKNKEPSLIQLVYVGVLIKRKNVSFLIDKFKTLSSDKIELIIIGDGNELEILKQKTGQDKRIKFKGFLDKPEELFHSKTIFINPSMSEGMPMAVIEALSCGVPCLLSNIKSHREIKILIPKGVELFDFEDNSFNNYLSVLINTLNSDVTIANDIKEKHKENFSINIMSERYFSVYEMLVDKSIYIIE